MLEKIEEVKQVIEKKFTLRNELSKMIIGTWASRCELRPDDSVSFIRSLSQTTLQAEQQSSRSEIESLVNRKIQKALSAFKSIKEVGDSSKSQGGSASGAGTGKGGVSNPSISKKRNKGKKRRLLAAPRKRICLSCASIEGTMTTSEEMTNAEGQATLPRSGRNGRKIGEEVPRMTEVLVRALFDQASVLPTKLPCWCRSRYHFRCIPIAG